MEKLKLHCDASSWETPLFKLKQWFSTNKRVFPWREHTTPYRVWVSEVMLQQTRADVVVPYFLRWIDLFPSVQQLALANESVVMKAWEGLGYYRRAKNLVRGAQHVVTVFGGELPNTAKLLLTIPGIGPYTSQAILAFAFKQQAAPIDGNVLRVMSRLFLLERSIDLESTRSLLRSFMLSWLPPQDAPVLSEALIELGACICKPTPLCDRCPLQSICKAAQMKQQQQFPKRCVRKKVITLLRWVAVVHYQQTIYLEYREAERAMQGLYEFPYEDLATIDQLQDKATLIRNMESYLGCKLSFVSDLEEQQHMFTHHKIKLFPSLLRAETPPKRLCYSKDQIKILPFSSGHRRIKNSMMQSIDPVLI